MDDPRSLPPGYAHPHASEEARVIAEQGLILRAQVGSGVHGTAIGGQDDRDETGRISLPVPEPDRSYLRAVRRGEVPLAEAVAAVTAAEARLLELREHAAVPEQPDRAWVDGWLHRSYLDQWQVARV